MFHIIKKLFKKIILSLVAVKELVRKLILRNLFMEECLAAVYLIYG